MTREEAAELSPVIQAFSEGRPIQYRLKDVKSAKWNDIYENYNEFSPHSFQYRIKPESKYRPFKDTEECWTEMKKHQPFGRLKMKDTESGYYILKSIANQVVIGLNETPFSYKRVFEDYIFADGIPFGVKVEE